jgi:sugar lactone lactonase YvrE
LSYPYDVRVDEQGRQYVCEFGNSRIQVFDANDRPLEIIGQAGSAPGEFANPWSIALDSKGNLYVADSQNHRVQKLIRRQIPNPKSQIPNKFQVFKFQRPPTMVAAWILGLWSLEFIWNLEFGIWNFPPE